MAEFALPRHSAVVERLRKRIELCRRHHTACEARYGRAAAERLELERQRSLALHQRCLQSKGKRTAKQRPPAPPAQAPAPVPVPAGPPQLHERVKRKLKTDDSPLNGSQQNGFVDGSFSGTKKLRLNGEDASGLLAVNGSSNGMPPMSPLHQRDKRSGEGAQGNGSHPLCLDNMKKEYLPDSNNGNSDAVGGFALIKEFKQEPPLDSTCVNQSGPSLSQSNMFPDINLNEQEWQELFDELNRSVPDQDIQDLFNEDFEEKKDIEPMTSDQTTLADNIIIKAEFSPPVFDHDQTESSQHRPSPSAPLFSSVTLALGSTAPSVSQSVLPAQGPTPVCTRPVSSVVLPGNPGLSVERSHAQQLQQMAANQKQRAQLMQKQQVQHSSPNQIQNWSAPLTQSPLGGPFSLEKPSSPSLYQQDFNQKLPGASMPSKSSSKAGGNYLQPNRVAMINQPPNTLGQTSTNSQAPMPNYANTKRLTHFEMSDSQRVVAPNQNKSAMFAYMRQQQVSHLGDEQKRMLVIKQELPQSGMTYRPHLQHAQDQNLGSVTRTQNAVQGSGPGTQAPLVSIAGNHGSSSYLSGQQQVVAMKQQQLLMEQQKQREQHLQLMEQQKQQYLQRQQLLAERGKQQEQQLQRHLTRAPPQYQEQQQNPYHVEQVGQFQGSPQVLPSVGNLATPNANSSRLFPQNQNMIQIAPSQSSVPSSSPAAGQPELGVTQYGNMHNVQQGMYNVGSNLNQMLSHSAQDTIPNGQHSNSLQRQPGRTRGNPLLTSYGQTHLSNSNLAQQQHNKGPGSQAVSKTPLQRLPSAVADQSASWQHQSLQNVNNQNQPNSNLVAFSSTSTFHARPSHPKISSQQFVQGMARVSLTTARPMGAINSTAGGQMMPTLGGPLSQTSQPSQVVPSLNQSVADMANFSSGQQMGARSSLHCNQPYQVRGSNQELPFGYSNQSGAGTLQGLPGDTDLMDSLLKNRTTEEWIIDLDEFLGSHH
ncbi:mastermind-like protein 1 [Narcine bancroftii]|uniref:mastermind-like protein 1 n=1 Tax=Narcine bancroftii TaxID=1343680 RepID=UPI003831D8B9